MKAILRVLAARWFLSLLGALAAALLVWFVGPLIGIADARPLEGEIARLITIMVILVAWGLYNIFTLAGQRRTDQQMVATITESAAPGRQSAAQSQSQSGAMADEEIGLLRKRLEEALLLLKKSAGGKGGSRYLYQLPWYMLIGPPGSGKTTALVNSGLNFPLVEKYGRDPVKGVGGTRNCDWWFTDDAVLLDTAGRYTTQDSHAAVDESAWKGFLALLKKFRPRQPLNGALVAISLSDVALLPPAERQAHARAIRQRLHELHTEFGVRFPVYVLFTKADLIAGFVEFFDDLDRGAREQVWGMTLNFDAGGETGKPAVEAFAAEFDALVQRLNDRLLERVQSESDLGKRALIVGFPAQIASLREPLKDFLDEIFMPNRYEGRPLLRGIYLTSGTQEGTPIDRMMGAMAATFGLDRQRVQGFSGAGRSYFLTRLLRGVVFAEASMVGADAAVERRQAWLRRGAYAAAALAFIGALGLWTMSYLGNQGLIGTFDSRMAEYEKLVTPLAQPVITNGDVESALPALRIARSLATGYGQVEGAPLALSFGLYQGDKLGSQAAAIYHRALDNVLLPRLLVRIGNQLRANLGNPDLIQQGLKVYLMLGAQGPLDKDLITSWLDADWSASYAGDRQPLHDELSAHLQALLDQPLPEIALDGQVVDAARRALLQSPLATRTYNNLKQSVAARQLAPWRPSDNAGPSPDRAIQRNSGKALTDPIPGLFTYAGYYKVFLPSLASLTREAARESWVLGDAAPKGNEVQLSAGLEHDVAQLYADDYVRSWDALLNDIGIVRFRDINHAAEVLNILAGPSSPLKSLYTAIAKETNLTKAPDAAGLAPAGAQAALASATAAAGKVAAALGQSLPAAPPAAQQVDDHFRVLQDFVGLGGTGPAPVDDFIRGLGDVYGQVSQLAQAGPGAPKPVPPGSPLANLPATASRLPAPLANAVNAVAASLNGLRTGNTRSQLNDSWRSDVLAFCSKALDARYPMVRSSAVDVNLDDFSRLFKPGGLIDTFFNANLKPFVDTSRSPWKWTSDLGIPADVLMQFQRAGTIRDLFFPDGAPAPKLKFEIIPVSLDASATQIIVDIGGQQAAYAHGPPQSTPIEWPGAPQGRVAFSPAQPPQPATITVDGAWSLFRLFDQGKVEPVAGLADRVRITFSVGGRNAVYELRANSVINALTMTELGDFRCPAKL